MGNLFSVSEKSVKLIPDHKAGV